MARKYPLSEVGCDSDVLNVNIDMAGEIPRHLEPGSANAREVARNPRDDDVMSNDLSSDVNSDVSSSLEQITLDDGIDQRDTNHTSCAVSQNDDDCQLYTLVNGVTGACDGTISLEDIPSLSLLLELEGLSVDEIDHSLKNGDLSEVVVIRPDIIELNSSSILDEAVLEDTKAALSARSG